MVWNTYPYTNFHELNLDWVINTVNKCVESIKAVDGTISITTEEILTKWLEDGTLINVLNNSYLSPVINQIDSASGRESIADKKIPVIDENGLIYGSAINVIDLMIKPRLPATGSVAVFDRNGNLEPMCFDRNYPIITADMLLLNTMTDEVLQVDNFSETSSGNSGITLKNGLQIMWGYIEIPLGSWTSAGAIYQQNVNVTNTFYQSFVRTPKVILGTPNNLNNPIWVSGYSATNTGISRVQVFSPEAYTGLTPVIPYLAIGY